MNKETFFSGSVSQQVHLANVQGKEQVSRNPYSIEYRMVRTVPVFTVVEIKVIYVLLLTGGFVMIVAQQFLDPNGSVLDPYRIHLIWIWIQHFGLSTDLDPIRIQGFDDQKLKNL